MDRPQLFLEETASERPELSQELAELGELYHKKLWHEISVRLEELISAPLFQTDGVLIALYQNFIASFASHINLLKLAKFAVAASRQIPSSQEGAEFLGDVISGLENLGTPRAAAQPILYLRMHVAEYQQASGQMEAAKKAFDTGDKELEGMEGVDPSVSAAVYSVGMAHHKARQDYGGFYRAALRYLSYIRQEDLTPETKLVEVLQDGPFAWLYELLLAFNNGDIHTYDSLCLKHAAKLNAQHERRLREKITILSLTELVSSLPPEERTLPLETIGERTKLPLDGVEFLLMKALSLKLIEAVIDQVAGTVRVSWVQPRVLTMDQVIRLQGQLDAWSDRVGDVQQSLQESAAGLIPVSTAA